MSSEHKSPEELADQLINMRVRSEIADLIRSDRAVSEEKLKEAEMALEMFQESESVLLRTTTQERDAALARADRAEAALEANRRHGECALDELKTELDTLRGENERLKESWQRDWNRWHLSAEESMKLRAKLDKATEGLSRLHSDLKEVPDWCVCKEDDAPCVRCKDSVTYEVEVRHILAALRSDEPSALVSTGELAEIIRAGQEWAKSSTPIRCDYGEECSGHASADERPCGYGHAPKEPQIGEAGVAQPAQNRELAPAVPASPSTPCEKCGGTREVRRRQPDSGVLVAVPCPSCMTWEFSGTGRATSRETGESVTGLDSPPTEAGESPVSDNRPGKSSLPVGPRGADGGTPVSRPAEVLSEEEVARHRITLRSTMDPSEYARQAALCDTIDALRRQLGEARGKEEWDRRAVALLTERAETAEKLLAEARERNERLEHAVRASAAAFKRYAEIHRSKGPGHEAKAADNRGLAMMCDAALDAPGGKEESK